MIQLNMLRNNINNLHNTLILLMIMRLLYTKNYQLKHSILDHFLKIHLNNIPNLFLKNCYPKLSLMNLFKLKVQDKQIIQWLKDFHFLI